MLLAAGRTLGFAVAFLLPIILVRIFTKEEFGTYKQIFLFAGLFMGFGQVGMAESLYYFLPRGPERAGRYVANTLLMLCMTGTICLLLLTVGANAVANWSNNPGLLTYMPTLGVFVALSLFAIGFEIVLVGCREYKFASILYGSSDAVRALALLIPILLTGSLWALLAGAVIFAALRSGTMVWYLGKRFKREFRPDLALLKEQLKYAIPFTLAAYASFNPLNLLVVGWVSTATFAVYMNGVTEVPIVDLLFNSYGNVLMVRMGEEIKHGRAVVGLWHDVVEKLALIFLPLTAALLLTSRELIRFLYTDQYLASVPIFTAYCPTILLAILPIDCVLRTFAKTRAILFLYLGRLIVMVACTSFFLRHFGLVGAVVFGFAVYALLKAVAVVYIGRTLMKVKVSEYLPWRFLGLTLLASLIAVLPAALVKAQLDLKPMWVGGITTLVYGAVYIALAIVFGLLPALDVRQRLRFILNPGR
jgi:O-antigen/teichoic acid export membrane protein